MIVRPFFYPAALLLLSFNLSGCALLLVGGGAAAGYAVTQDGVEGYSDAGYSSIYDAAYGVVGKNYTITKASMDSGVIEAEEGDSRSVKIVLTRVTPASTKIEVKARKGYSLLPDIDTAQQIYNHIINRIS